MPKHSWLKEILDEVDQYAIENNLPTLSANVGEVWQVASKEIPGFEEVRFANGDGSKNRSEG